MEVKPNTVSSKLTDPVGTATLSVPSNCAPGVPHGSAVAAMFQVLVATSQTLSKRFALMVLLRFCWVTVRNRRALVIIALAGIAAKPVNLMAVASSAPGAYLVACISVKPLWLVFGFGLFRPLSTVPAKLLAVLLPKVCVIAPAAAVGIAEVLAHSHELVAVVLVSPLVLGFAAVFVHNQLLDAVVFRLVLRLALVLDHSHELVAVVLTLEPTVGLAAVLLHSQLLDALVPRTIPAFAEVFDHSHDAVAAVPRVTVTVADVLLQSHELDDDVPRVAVKFALVLDHNQLDVAVVLTLEPTVTLAAVFVHNHDDVAVVFRVVPLAGSASKSSSNHDSGLAQWSNHSNGTRSLSQASSLAIGH